MRLKAFKTPDNKVCYAFFKLANLQIMDKVEFYRQLQLQTQAIVSGESDLIANMANISAILFENLEQVNWAGFYRLQNDMLVLGPFQGKVACVRIPVGTGVCGTAVSTESTQRIANVHEFDGHIACDAQSNSEIVIPVYKDEQVIAVLDIDSTAYDRFDGADQVGLEAIVSTLEQAIN